MVRYKWLSNNSTGGNCKREVCIVAQNIGKIQKVNIIGEISDKDDILTVEEKSIYLNGNMIKIRLEMIPWKR